ncbi:SCF E3 ubiquitin ligase complex F-box protein grrA [Nilaparvata lugens]|uniref:SCF E3 ubiquitin ligase complex F-box protein grrA n=1 Tax=Nilaparvata lugens TaxID=108931 RepID=UPI000B98209B|nr:SCF E3 ubiquitin ligase complex F-box protein grrA [Nilaparvata lugens]
MPQKKQPMALESLALGAVRTWTKMVATHIMDPVCDALQQQGVHQFATLLSTAILTINEALYASVPWYLIDSVAVQVLSSIDELVQETRTESTESEHRLHMQLYMARLKVIVSLSEAVAHPQLRTLDVSRWPKIIRHVLNGTLFKLSGLEKLDLGGGSSGWGTSEAEKNVLSGVVAMHNLTSLYLCLDCTDNILAAVAANCHRLQFLDVTSSRSVTDRSIPGLCSCTSLKTLKLHRTSITTKGYKTLLLSLPELREFGRCDVLGDVLESVAKNRKTPLGLHSLEGRDLGDTEMRLLTLMCPFLSRITLSHFEKVCDLSLLGQLERLSELKLSSCDFYSDKVFRLLELRGSTITQLHLEDVNELDNHALFAIGRQCPNLNNFELHHCELGEGVLSPYIKTDDLFESLQRLVCISDGSSSTVELLLCYSPNIRSVQLGSSTEVYDRTFSTILNHNPMRFLEELRIHYSYDLSMRTVRKLMDSCGNLRVLSELEYWDGITEAELKEFHHHIRTNNLELDITPTLSR